MTILQLQSMNMWRSLTRNARFELPTCLVFMPWLSCSFAMSMGAKPIMFEGFQTGPILVQCCFAWQTWRFVTFSRLWKSVESRCVWRAQYFCEVSRRWPAFFVARAAHYTLHFTLHTLHFTLRTLHFTLCTAHFSLYTPHFTLHTLHCTLYARHFTLHTLHSILLHSRLCTPHSTLRTPPSFIFHSLRCTGMATGEKCTRLFK